MADPITIPVVRGIGAATASLVAQACLGHGVGSGGERPQMVGPGSRKAVLWAIAWAEGEPIVAEELAALAGVSRSMAYEAVRSLQRDGIVTVDGAGGRHPNRYRILRDGLARCVTPARLGAARRVARDRKDGAGR